MLRKIVILFTVISLVGCGTTTAVRSSGDQGLATPEILSFVKNTKNDGVLADLDPRGNPYTITIFNSVVGGMTTTKTKTVLHFIMDNTGFVVLNAMGQPVAEKKVTFEYEGGGWVQVAVQLFGTAVTAAIIGTTMGIGRPCRGCGGGGGTQIINNPQSFSEAGAFSDANVNSVTDVGVGCSTC